MKKIVSTTIVDQANKHSDFIAGAGIGYALGVLIGLTYTVCLL